MSAVDLALFRLRAFEHDWVEQLAAPGQERLTAALWEESRRWIEAGRRIGYFARTRLELSLEATSDLAVKRCFRELTDEVPFADGDAFAEALAVAQDDLTPGRRRYLDLLLFADDDAWSRKLDELWAHAEALADADGAQIRRGAAPQWLDAVSWAILGPESELEDSVPSPARWRSPALLTRLEPDRQAALAEVRMLLGETMLAEFGEAEDTVVELAPDPRPPATRTDWVDWVRERLGRASLVPEFSLRIAALRGASGERLVLRGAGGIEATLRRRAEAQLLLEMSELPADVSGTLVIGFPSAGEAPIDWSFPVATVAEVEVSDGWLEVVIGRSEAPLVELAAAFADIIVMRP